MSGPITTAALLLAPGLPLALGILWGIPGLRPRIGALVPWAAVPALLLALFGPPDEVVHLSWLLFGSALGMTETTRVFLGFTALIWLAAALHGRSHLQTGDSCARYCVFWLLTLGGNIGLILALDVALFYTSFALMTFAAYGLIVHQTGAAARRAGRVYLVLAVLGESLILLGLLLAASGTATPLLPMLAELPAAIAAAPERDLIIAALWLGFGVKAGLPLLHFSLPLAYTAAPVPVAAVLAGAMVKAGLLGWLVTLPLGAMAFPGWGEVMMVTGLVAAFAGAVIGVQQTHPRTVLAYSSVSQMGLIGIAVGAWMYAPALGPLLLPAIAIFALHHALAKGALFLGTDAVQNRGRPAPRWLWVGLAIPALALAGVLPSGLLAKASLKSALLAEGHLPAMWDHLPLLLALAAVGTTVLMARFLWLLRTETVRHAAPTGPGVGWGLLTLASLLGLLLLAWWGIRGDWPGTAFDWIGVLWPVLAGLALALMAWRWLRPAPIPAGDALVLLTPLPKLALRAAHALGMTGPAIQHRLRRLQTGSLARYNRVDRRLGRASEQLWRRDAALLFTLLLALMTLLGLHLG